MSEPVPSNADDRADATRLAALDRYNILDTPEEPAFDRVTRMTRAIFDVSMSTVTLIDGHRQWFKSQQGMADRETPRGPALCNVAIRAATPLIVPDTLEDDRFKDNPFVVGPPYIRFYAGIPLVMPDGAIIGTLCAMDHVPQPFDDRATAILRDLADVVIEEIVRRPAETSAAEAMQVTDAPAPLPSQRRVLKAGRMSFNGGRSVIDCTVRAMSDGGASILVSSTDGIPENFKLGIPADNWSRSCRITARRDKLVDVAFE